MRLCSSNLYGLLVWQKMSQVDLGSVHYTVDTVKTLVLNSKHLAGVRHFTLGYSAASRYFGHVSSLLEILGKQLISFEADISRRNYDTLLSVSKMINTQNLVCLYLKGAFMHDLFQPKSLPRLRVLHCTAARAMQRSIAEATGNLVELRVCWESESLDLREADPLTLEILTDFAKPLHANPSLELFSFDVDAITVIEAFYIGLAPSWIELLNRIEKVWPLPLWKLMLNGEYFVNEFIRWGNERTDEKSQPMADVADRLVAEVTKQEVRRRLKTAKGTLRGHLYDEVMARIS